jgi:hypothetical protein
MAHSARKERDHDATVRYQPAEAQSPTSAIADPGRTLCKKFDQKAAPNLPAGHVLVGGTYKPMRMAI